jgi:hypothetical protein
LIGACSAFADAIDFSLSTTGSFSLGTPGGLSFAGIGQAPPGGTAGFTGTTTGGNLALTDLGLFTLVKPSQGSDVYQDHTFTLNVLFFLPTGIDGGGQATYSAELSGTVNTQQGSLSIDFGPTQHLTFGGTGSFDLTVDDLFMDIPHRSGESIQRVLTGQITNATLSSATALPQAVETPEPVSMVLLGTSILLLAGKARRRLRSQNT